MGGVISYVLEQNNVADIAMAYEDSQARKLLFEICRTIYFQTSDDALIYRFGHLFFTGSYQRKCYCCICI